MKFIILIAGIQGVFKRLTMSDLYCSVQGTDDRQYYEVLGFITTPAGYVQAVCKDRFGSVTTQSIEKMKIVNSDIYMQRRT